MSIRRKVLLGSLLSLMLTACGQKGPLFIAEPPAVNEPDPSVQPESDRAARQTPPIED